MPHLPILNRRQFMQASASLAAGLLLPGGVAAANQTIRKAIPSSGELLPVIGMGTSRTFETGGDADMLARLGEVIQAFFDHGGGMIDSSPMYGSAQQVIGQLLPTINGEKNLFAATKVWTRGRESGLRQMEESRRLWGVERFDLMQIHNLLDWETHLESLLQMKADGTIRYVGITTSHGRDHNALERILQQHPFDFVQLTYNLGNREAESRLLPIAQERGIGVIVNRPFQRGALFRKVKGKPVPAWAEEFGCASWGQFFLKFAVSHPAVTCAIPATTKVKHMRDNMQAGWGQLPDPEQRARMITYFASL
ncbi:aldo/keto reductase [Sedimenticola thiotaurini]|nr:aldo/keto reductase [Sedimenticola thiotaurini]